MSGTWILTRRMHSQWNQFSFAICQFSFNKLACSMLNAPKPRNLQQNRCNISLFFVFVVYFNFVTGRWINILFLNGWRIANCRLRYSLFGKWTKNEKKKIENETEWYENWNKFHNGGGLRWILDFLKNAKFHFTSIFHRWQFHSIFSTMHWWWLCSTATNVKLKKNSEF